MALSDHLRMRNDLVCLRRLPEQETVGSIVLAPSARKKSTVCEVLAVGPGIYRGKRLIPCEVQPGDVVHIHDWQGEDHQIHGEKYTFIHDDEILAIEQRAQQ